MNNTHAVVSAIQRTLLAVQAKRLGVDVQAATQTALQQLLDQGLVLQKHIHVLNNEPENDTTLSPSQMGKNILDCQHSGVSQTGNVQSSENKIISQSNAADVIQHMANRHSQVDVFESQRDYTQDSQCQCVSASQFCDSQYYDCTGRFDSQEDLFSDGNNPSSVWPKTQPAQSQNKRPERSQHPQAGLADSVSQENQSRGSDLHKLNGCDFSQRNGEKSENSKNGLKRSGLDDVPKTAGGEETAVPGAAERLHLEVTELGRATFKGTGNLNFID